MINIFYSNVWLDIELCHKLAILNPHIISFGASAWTARRSSQHTANTRYLVKTTTTKSFIDVYALLGKKFQTQNTHQRRRTRHAIIDIAQSALTTTVSSQSRKAARQNDFRGDGLERFSEETKKKNYEKLELRSNRRPKSRNLRWS